MAQNNEILKLEEQIAAWKKDYKKVYKSSIGDVEVYWRKLRRKEYIEVMEKDYDLYQKQEEICKYVILNLDDLEEIFDENAGFVITLSEEVMFYSGFNISTTEV